MPSAGIAEGALPRPASAAATETLVYVLLALFAVGVNLEIKGMLPGGLGAPLESALRWLPGLALSATLLAFHRPWDGILRSWPITIFVLAILQSSILSPDPVRSNIEFGRDLPVFLMLFAILANTIDERRFWTTLAYALSICSILSLLTTVIVPSQAWMNYEWGPSQWRLRGITSHAVTLTAFSGLGAVLTSVLFLHADDYRKRMLYAAFAAANLLAFEWGSSRGPWLGVLLAYAMLAALYVARLSRPVGGAVLLLLALVVPTIVAGAYVYLHAIPAQSIIDFAFSFHDQRMMTLAERALIWEVAREHIAQSPFLGGGHALGVTVNHYLSDEDGFYPSYHSLFLHFWSESGVFALISLVVITFGAYFANLFLSLRSAPATLATIRLVTIAFILGCAMFDAPFQARPIMLAGLAAYAFVVRKA